MALDISEALRYLGVTGIPDDDLSAQLDGLARELEERITPRFRWTLANVSDLALPGQTAARMLADCRQAAVLVCTLGAAFDLWMRREQQRDMTRAALLDALGSVYVEAACDAAEQEILARFPGMYLTDRFSPGYGDLPLTVQPALMALAGAGHIGVMLTDSLLMNPQKSVTALIGIADRPQPARIRGCRFCAMKDHCQYRKGGTTCHVST